MDRLEQEEATLDFRGGAMGRAHPLHTGGPASIPGTTRSPQLPPNTSPEQCYSKQVLWLLAQ